MGRLMKRNGFRVLKRKALTHCCFPFQYFLLNLGKGLLNLKILPKKIQHTGDQFNPHTSRQSPLEGWAYHFFRFIDGFTKNIDANQSSVAIFVKAQKH